ncbi:hypothetical protein Mapa_005235 [Marchantia paleacea]|nr:hypothetical protein Mapa_005235 [Marchantia paleacea]
MDAFKVLLSRDAWTGTVAEFIATFLFVYLGCGSVVASGSLSGTLDSARLLVIATAHGLAIAALASATAGLSGGHINPAVTLGMVLVRQMSVIKGLMYWVAQFSGAVLGAGLLHDVLPSSIQGGLGAHGVSKISMFDGVIYEVVMSFALIFVIFGTAVDRRGTGNTAPLAIGFTVLVDHLVGVPFTGASMNPARSLGPAVWKGQWDGFWVYLVGPFFGACLAASSYTVLFLLTDPTRKGSDVPIISLEKSSYQDNHDLV